LFFERPDSGEIAILVHINFPDEKDREDPGEFLELVRSAGADPVVLIQGSRSRPSSKFFVGDGKLEEIRQAVEEHEADIVLFNHALSPSQERNVEQELECRVLDRTGLILDIFAQRARTHEGQLQVELAQLEYMSTRLVRGWTHLERQKGGIGLRGPGETQLESDRRLLRERIRTINKRMEKVRTQRDQNRRSRRRAEIPSVSLVGYTNAGKSTLFNALTDADVYAADQLFATLDPTLRRITMPDAGPVVMADTVGFIRHLPHKLVEAFRATLQEAEEATLLIHVIDAADDTRDENIEQVNLVLEEIGADKIPSLLVYNKIDCLPGYESRIERDDQGMPERVWLSAVNGDGLDLLLQAIGERLCDDLYTNRLELAPSEGRLRAILYEQGAVLSEEINESGEFVLDIRIPKPDFIQILCRVGIDPKRYFPNYGIEDFMLDSDLEVS
jgi:GTP-binding protein HflX